VYQHADYNADLKARGVLMANDSLKSSAVRFHKHDGTHGCSMVPSRPRSSSAVFLLDVTPAAGVVFANACPAAEGHDRGETGLLRVSR
jgi:hypothetical protein